MLVEALITVGRTGYLNTVQKSSGVLHFMASTHDLGVKMVYD